MEATRPRVTLSALIAFATEWFTAALFLLGTLVIAVLVVRELRVAPRPNTAPAEPTSSVPSVPAEAVSIPALALGQANEIKVGDAMTDAVARLGTSVRLIKQSTERGPLGQREIRTYQLAGTSFILVFEPFERRGALRVAAIYLV
jgi:hypothetical protein